MNLVRAADSAEVLDRFHSQLELVEIVARQVYRSVRWGIELDDLVSAGREGLLDAARRYDVEQQVPFRAYANFRVRGAVLDGLRRMSALSRRTYERLAALEAASLVSEGQAEQALSEPSNQMGEAQAEEALESHMKAMVAAAAVALASVAIRADMEETAPPDPESAFARAELLAMVRAELGSLAPEEGEIVRRHYFEGHRLEDIAADLDMSKSWASRLHTRAMARLAARLKPIAEAERAEV